MIDLSVTREDAYALLVELGQRKRTVAEDRLRAVLIESLTAAGVI